MPIKKKVVNPANNQYTQAAGDTQRCILTAPLARDLASEFPTVPLYKLPVANATLQAWDCNARNFFVTLADPAITIYAKRNALPAALERALFRVWSSDTSFPISSVAAAQAGSTNGAYRLLSEITATQWLAVRRSGVAMCVQKSTLSATTDKFIDQTTVPIHQFFGEDLAETQMGKDE
jgi:hypothetical protein